MLETTLDLEGLPLLRYHSGYGAETHYFAEQDPRYRGEGAKRNTTPSKIHAPGAGESSGLENITRNRSTNYTILRAIQYSSSTILSSLEVNNRQGKQCECG